MPRAAHPHSKKVWPGQRLPEIKNASHRGNCSSEAQIFVGEEQVSQVPQIVARQPRLLLVDGEKIVCTTLVIIFKASKYEVRWSHSAEDVLQLLDDWVPDLAIVEMYLLKTNGAELARRILIRNPNCRVLLTSAGPEGGDIVKELLAQGYRFDLVAKPVPPRVLLQWARSGVLKENLGES